MLSDDDLINTQGGYNPPKIKIKPVFIFPPKPFALFKWLFHFPNGFLWPWATIHILIAFLSYLYFSPTIQESQNFSLSWFLIILFRNFFVLFVYTGLWHLWLYGLNAQKNEFKHNLKTLEKGKKWLFGSQTKENMFYSLVSAVPIWTAYESLMWWCFANGYLLFPINDFLSNPIYFFLILIIIPLWQHFHFYISHRLTHWKPLYKWVHYLHHKNINPGPWSGLSMHPLEHIIYLSNVLIFLIIPCHPLHFIYLMMHSTLGAQKGHVGYERLIINKKNKSTLPAGNYFHYLHHKYFECNYGDLTSPLDTWFGTFHDGTKKTHKKIFANRTE